MSELKRPPGPPGLPILGNTLQYGRDPLGLLTRCAREYGDIVRLRLGFGTFHVLNHPDLVERVLRELADKVRKDELTRSISSILGQGLVTSDGPFWRRQRKLAQPAFQHQAIERYGDVMVGHSLRLRDDWRKGGTRDVHQDMMWLTLGIVAKTLFNSDVAEEAHEISEAIEEMMRFFLGPMHLLPHHEKIPTPGAFRFRAAVKRVDAVIYNIIRRRRESGDNPGDLLSYLLAARDDEGSGMTDLQLRDECVTLFLAGHETTALTLSFALLLLAAHPVTYDRLNAELDRVLEGRSPTSADMPRLVYTTWVVRESMRLYPPAWAIGRQATEEVEVGGYRASKGTQFLISQWVLHRDPRWFDRPDEFQPERWDNDLIRTLPKGVYIPFGDGPRVCIGNHFAMMEAVLILATLCQGYRLGSVPGETLTLAPSITLRPLTGTRMIPHARVGSVPQPG